MKKIVLSLSVIGCLLAFTGCGGVNQEAAGNAPCSCTAKNTAENPQISK